MTTNQSICSTSTFAIVCFLTGSVFADQPNIDEGSDAESRPKTLLRVDFNGESDDDIAIAHSLEYTECQA